MRLPGMVLPGNGSRTKPLPDGFGAVVAGSKIGRLLRYPRRLKSPLHCAVVGTFPWPVLPLRTRVPSYAPKNIVLLWIPGPPRVAPKRLYRNGDLESPAR